MLAACGSDGPAGPGGTSTMKDPVGSYQISSINGKALPFVLVQSDTVGLFSYEIVSGTSALTADGKYVNVLTYRQTLPGSVENFVDSVSGTWSLSGTTVSFVNALDQSAIDKAEWSNTGRLTFSETMDGASDTLKFVYDIKK